MTRHLMLVNKGFEHKDTSGINLRTSPQLLDNSCQYREEDFKNKIVLKRVHYKWKS